ncbi:MAG: toll/interleukin-1 receptor domain-containing protein [Gemmataceae bacterium]
MGGSKEIFISYRRDTGSELTEVIKRDLSFRGYSIFKDTHDLKAGHWQEDLARQINGCKDFILVVTPGSLDRCKSDPNDVVLFEIRLALAARKNFILVVKRDKNQSPSEFFRGLPASIADLPKHNWIEYTNEDSEAKLKKIRSFLESSPSVWELASNRYGKQILAGMVCIGMLVCSVLAWFLLGSSGRIETKVEGIAKDTKSNQETLEKVQDQSGQISIDTKSIRNESKEIVEKTRQMSKDTV